MLTTPPHAALESVTRPKQARSRKTLERILEAAEALITEKGVADTSIPEIVRRAGSSVGGFYARFKDRNELLQALEERFFHEMLHLVDSVVGSQREADSSVAEIVETSTALLVRIARERRNLITAFVHRATQDEASRAQAMRFRAIVSERLAELLLPRRVQMRHPDPELAVHLGVQMAFGMLMPLILVGEIRVAGRVLTDEELCREIARGLLGFVGAQPESDRENEGGKSG